MLTTSLTSTDLLFLLQGAWTTILLTLWAMLLGTAGGVICGLLRATLPRATLPLAGARPSVDMPGRQRNTRGKKRP